MIMHLDNVDISIVCFKVFPSAYPHLLFLQACKSGSNFASSFGGTFFQQY